MIFETFKFFNFIFKIGNFPLFRQFFAVIAIEEIPRDDRHFETMTEIQAVQVMSELMAKNVPFSAVTRGEDKVSLTVSKNDVPVLNDVMRSAIGKTVRTNSRENSENCRKSTLNITVLSRKKSVLLALNRKIPHEKSLPDYNSKIFPILR